MYIIKDGEVECLKGDKVIRTLKKGDNFGQKALLEGGIRSLDVKAKTDCKIYSISTEFFKNQFGENFREQLYFNFVNTVLKDQAQSKNQNDPEMEKLFRSLAGKDGDYVYKRKLSDIIKMFGLPINLNSFFQPVGGQEELSFNEFCCLFRADKADENLRKTFINFIDKSSKEPEEKEDINTIYKANFPIKYYGE